MNNYNRKDHLAQLHDKRKFNTSQRVNDAIQKLIKYKKNINFNSVAAASGLSKATLYNNLDIKERIISLRKQQSLLPSPLEQKLEMNENSKDAIISSLRRKVKKLEEDNKQLREQIKVTYADIYKNI